MRCIGKEIFSRESASVPLVNRLQVMAGVDTTRRRVTGNTDACNQEDASGQSRRQRDVGYLWHVEQVMDAASQFMVLPREVDGGFINLTELHVPRAVAILLSFGPQFVPPHMINLIDMCQTVEYLHDCIEADPNKPEGIMRLYYTQIFDELMRVLGTGQVVSARDRVLRLLYTQTRDFLSSHKDICVVQSDKGRSTLR